MNLTETQKRSIFKDLANKSQYAVGIDYKFDQYYKNRIAVLNAVQKVYKEVKESPEKFAISQEVLDMVEHGMKVRRDIGKSVVTAEELPKDVDEKQLVLGVRSKAWRLLDAKLNHLSRNKKAFKAESLMSLAKVAGITFDKSQIVRGEATEHIALKARVDENITAQEAMSQLLKIRELTAQEE